MVLVSGRIFIGATSQFGVFSFDIGKVGKFLGFDIDLSFCGFLFLFGLELDVQ